MTVFVEIVGKGPNLTMLHGWGLSGAVWDGVRDALSERYTLHLIDLPGHGHSQAAPVTTLDAMVDAIAEVMPARSDLLGWSIGGQAALELARRYPDRVGKLLLVASTPCFLQREDWRDAMSPKALASFSARLSDDTAATIKSFLALQVLNQPRMHEAIAMLQAAVASRATPAPAALAAGLALLESTDLRVQVPDVSHSSLVMQGDHDALTPEPAGRWLAENLPNARYAMIPHAAHAPFLSHRDAFLHELHTFLAE